MLKKIIITGFTSLVGLLAQAPAKALPIECYIGSSLNYQICDVQNPEASMFVVLWEDGDITAIKEKETSSGTWANVAHARPDETIYATGVRYPRIHYNNGNWVCYHKDPAGLGAIDFCLKAPEQ
ncbi:MAG: hypothetical protein F6K31_15770 [Symploca sp. SIO2G7]|nr:hypothetical protein [Symploca sp. SIO2G7]